MKLPLLALLTLISCQQLFALEQGAFLGIDYMTGGVGIEELEILEKESGKYSLKILVAEKDKYLSSVNIIILNEDDQLMLEKVLDGPFLYVNLAAGNYTVQASGFGESFERKITITEENQTKLVFRWK